MVIGFSRLPAGTSGLVSARPEPDLTEAGYVEIELVASGLATSYADDGLPRNGRFALTPLGRAEFATRVLLRRPVDPAAFSGTVVVEWLNVSSGNDAAPEWTFLGEEILRSGHAWAGVSAQYVGVEGGHEAVHVAERPSRGLRSRERYAALHHPGDAYSYDIFGQVAAGLGEACDDLDVQVLLAAGESQSAICLTTYIDGVHPVAPVFDGFLVHSRGAVCAPLDDVGTGIRVDAALAGGPVLIRDDLAEPVIVVETEGDLFDRIGYLPARQPDSATLRLWEIAGSAHGDRFLMGGFESILGCEVPVNDGQQVFVLRAALRHLDGWARGLSTPPSAPRLEVAGDGFVLDAVGNVLGGVRTPAVEAPTQVLSGRPAPDAADACRLFGSTIALDEPPFASRAEYLAAYQAATDAGIAGGFLLADDRAEILADARWAGDDVLNAARPPRSARARTT